MFESDCVLCASSKMVYVNQIVRVIERINSIRVLNSKYGIDNNGLMISSCKVTKQFL